MPRQAEEAPKPVAEPAQHLLKDGDRSPAQQCSGPSLGGQRGSERGSSQGGKVPVEVVGGHC